MTMNEENLAEAKTMRQSWEARAGSDPLYAIDARRRNWELRDFYTGGAQLVKELVDPALNVLSVDPSGLRVLEIGCGMGRLFEGLSARFAEVWGIDISQGMIDQGRAQCPVQAKWILGDGVSLSGVDDESIDYALSYQVFIHARQPSVIRGYLDEIQRVLKPGGTFQVHLRGGSNSFRQAMVRAMPRPLRLASAGALRKVGLLHLPGDIDTWLGCVVPPDQGLSMSAAAGFVDSAAFDIKFNGFPKGHTATYWVVGRKAARAV